MPHLFSQYLSPLDLLPAKTNFGSGCLPLYNLWLFSLGSFVASPVPSLFIRIVTMPSSLESLSHSSCFTVISKALTVWFITNCGKLFKRREYQTIILVPEKTVCRLRNNNWNLIWNNWLVHNWERSMKRLLIVTLFIYLICSAQHAKCQAGWVTSWNQDCLEKYQ